MTSTSARAPQAVAVIPASADVTPGVRPWQFFVIAGMLGATATVVVSTGQTAAPVIILSLTVVAASLVGLGAYRTLRPLVADEDVSAPTLLEGRTRAALDREKSLTLRAIKELEFDFAMGKVARADFDEMSGRLRARAVGLLRQLDADTSYRSAIEQELEVRLAREAPAVIEATPRDPHVGVYCTRCGTGNDGDAQFCKRCGTPLVA